MAKRDHLILDTRKGLDPDKYLDPRSNFRTSKQLIDGYKLYVKLKPQEKRSDRKVTLIGRPLPNDKVSLYRYAFVDGKKKYEPTGVILYPETSGEVKEDNKRKVNDETVNCARLKIALIDGNTTFNPKPRKLEKTLLADYVESLIVIFKPSFGRLLQSLARHIRIYNASLRVADVDDEIIMDFISYLKNRAVSLNWTKNKDNAPRLADNTQADLLSILSMVLNQAVREKKILNNPFYLIPRGIRPKHDNERRTYLTPKEVAKLMVTPYPCDQNKKDFKPDTPKAFFFSVFSGLRFSDVTTLTGENVKEDEGGTYIDFKTEKTDKHQVLYLNDMALQYLPRHKDKKQVLFDIPCNKQTNNNISKWCEKAGINKKVTFHVARHTTATMELNAGVPIEEVSNQLGHSGIKTTQIYAKIMRNTQRNATNKMADYFKEQTADE